MLAREQVRIGVFHARHFAPGHGVAGHEDARVFLEHAAHGVDHVALGRAHVHHQHGRIDGGIFTPTEAAAVAAVYGIFVGLFIYKELKFRDFPQIIFQAVIGTTMIMLLVGAANVFGWLLTSLQIPHRLGEFVVSITTSPIMFLMALNVLLLIAGTMVNASAAVVILTPIFLPVAKTLGIDPLFFGVLMVVNLAIGCITPPVGLDLFVASAITKVPIERVMIASLPYLGALLVTLVILTLFPWFVTVLPYAMR